jgi:dienelactone hydrolase
MDEIRNLVGEFPSGVSLDVKILEKIDCDSYVREKIEYSTEKNERVRAYVCVPKNINGKLPAVFCHHQHAGQFELGKSEVVGLAGDPDQAYAKELAEKGYLTFSPDAIAFEERNWSGKSGQTEYYELTTRLVKGTTLMAKVLHDVSVGLDYLTSRGDVDVSKIGFIGHSYGGRMALWVPAFDKRIKVSVSNCGCIPYKLSMGREAGIQMEFCIPGIAKKNDIDDVIKQFNNCSLLISATTDDKWSWSAEELYESVKEKLKGDVALKIYDGKHIFTEEMRKQAYEFIDQRLMTSSKSS